MASAATVGRRRDPTAADNDGTQIGGADYRFPSAAGLSLCVATGASQAADTGSARAPRRTADQRTRRRRGRTVGALRLAARSRRCDHLDADRVRLAERNRAEGAVVHWRIKYCDASGNCGSTDPMSFRIQSSTTQAAVVVPAGRTCRRSRRA